MIHLVLGLAFLVALIDWFAVWKKNRILEGYVKPLTMGLLITWVIIFGSQEEVLNTNLVYFVIGLGFCLLGDFFLFLPPERFFVFGLAAFLIGHVWYIVGFGGFEQLSDFLIPSLIYLFVIGVAAYQIVGKLIAGLRRNKKERLIGPLILYAIVISVMLGSAGLRFFDSSWTTAGAYLVAGGALFFYISDVLNAWERFVNKFGHDRLIIMATYHLGQFGLAIGAALHFAGKLPG